MPRRTRHDRPSGESAARSRDHPGAASERDGDCRTPERSARAGDENPVAGGERDGAHGVDHDGGAVHDGGRLRGVETMTVDRIARRHRDVLARAAVAMHADDGLLRAVGFVSGLAMRALPAGDVGFDDDGLPYPPPVYARSDRDDLSCGVDPEDAGQLRL
jgi:hypothetical protein